jgi:hypothetical protein
LIRQQVIRSDRNFLLRPATSPKMLRRKTPSSFGAATPNRRSAGVVERHRLPFSDDGT